MSGIGEASVVLGLISSVIAIFETAQQIYEAANDVKGLPKKFRTASEQIPLVYHILSLAKKNVQAQQVSEQALQSAQSVLQRCHECAVSVKDIFDKTIPAPDASRAERLKKAVGLQMKSSKVKENMEEVIRGMDLLAQNQVFHDAAALEDIKTAVEQLSNLSDEEDLQQFVHSGAGALNANTGLGQQQNYNNSGSGSQYNAEKQFFGRDQVDNQSNVVNHYYYRGDRRSLVYSSSRQGNSPYSMTASEKGFLATIGPRRYINIQERVEGTCLWSTETAQYHSWAQSSRPSVLWITGGAGTGKTTLTNYLIEHIKGENEVYSSDLSVCSFFCSRDVEGQHDISSILQDLVLQLVEHDTEVLRQIKSKYGVTKKDYSWPWETVWRMFENAINLLPHQRIYVVIDALDECDDNLQEHLLKKLQKLLSSMASSSRAILKRIKVVISGQPRIHTVWKESSIDHYHINIEDQVLVAQDILLFVDDRITELVREGLFSEIVGRRLRKAILSMSQNSFLWLTVVFQHMKESLYYRQAHLEDILSQVPQSLQQAYTRYLPRLHNDQIPILQSYLRLLVASSRPLRLVEIDIFTLLHDKKSHPDSSINGEDDKVIRASIQKALGPLVRFPQDTAQFIHSTAKDFFVLLAQQPAHDLYSTHGTDLTQAHLFCFRSCAGYLLHESMPRNLFDTFAEESFSINAESPISDLEHQHEDDALTRLFDLKDVDFLRDEETIEMEACESIRQHLKAYEYAATNWFYHFARCQTLADEGDVEKAIKLLTPASDYLNNWYRYLSQRSQLRLPSISGSSAITLAAMFDLTKVVQVLHRESGQRQSPRDMSISLYWAASRGSVGAVEMLLEYGAPASSEQSQHVPLIAATRVNSTAICKSLLAAAEVDPNQADDCGKSPLVLAAELDHVEILRLLLSHPHTDVNYRDLDQRTALIAACSNGSTESVRTLLKDGRVDVNMVDVKGRSSLHHASKTGSVAIVKQLTKLTPIDLGIRDNDGRNAISIAAQEGHLDVVRTLRHNGVQAGVVDRNGRNALSWAANSLKANTPVDDKGLSVLEYLVQKLPNEVDVPDESGWTPLAWALDSPGYITSVFTLTQSPSVDINHRDKTFGRCILAWAASSGMIEIVEYLLHRPGLEVDLPCFDGRTALSYAATNGMVNVVKLLLDTGNASPHQPDHKGRTPADWAERNGFMEIVALLRAISASGRVNAAVLQERVKSR